MKEKLEQELLNSLEVVKGYLTKGAEFAGEQAPLVVEEIVRFNLWYLGVSLTIGVFLLVGVPWIIFRKACKLVEENEDLSLYGISTVSALPAGIGLIVIVETLEPFLMCLTAPRLFVIEYLAGMLK